MIEGTPNENVNRQDLLVTRAAVGPGVEVSLRMVDLMLADGDYANAVRGKLVRFYLPDVCRVEEKAKTSKRNVARRV